MPVINVSVNFNNDDAADVVDGIIQLIDDELDDININKFFTSAVKKELINCLANNINNEKLFKDIIGNKIYLEWNYIAGDEGLTYKDFKCLKPLIDPIMEKIKLFVAENNKKIEEQKKKNDQKKIKDSIKMLKANGFEVKIKK